MTIKYRQRKLRFIIPQPGYEALACAIVQQAIRDYKDRDTSIVELLRIRDFLTSNWFEFLCDFDGAAILARLDKYRERMGYADINLIINNRDTNRYYFTRAKHMGCNRTKKN